MTAFHWSKCLLIIAFGAVVMLIGTLPWNRFGTAQKPWRRAVLVCGGLFFVVGGLLSLVFLRN